MAVEFFVKAYLVAFDLTFVVAFKALVLVPFDSCFVILDKCEFFVDCYFDMVFCFHLIYNFLPFPYFFLVD
jgi:hypothetical protein